MEITFEKYKELASQGYELIPLTKEILADTETPVTIFLKARSMGNSFLLESVEQKEGAGRYSFIGYQPETAAFLKNNELEILGKKTSYEENPLHTLRERFFGKKVCRYEGLPPFLGGLVGYISYESVRFFDKIQFSKKPGLGLPDMAFLWTNALIAVDSRTQKLQLLVLSSVDAENPQKSYEEGQLKIEEMLSMMRKDFPFPAIEEEETGEVKLSSNMKKEDFYKKVEQAKEYIAAGDAFQIVLSQRFCAQTRFSPFNIYRSLRSVNPSPYMYFLDFDNFQVIGASPEVMVKLSEDQKIEVKPIAGTRPRGKSREEDLNLEKELSADEKERAEHIMLVDLGRNDVGRVATAGTVQVSELMQVERYSHVMHLVSKVEGRVDSRFNWVDALRATFPAGTVSGAPKIRAMQIIDELEPDVRGPYAGSVLYVSADGVLDSCITIRTLIYQDGKIYGQAGAGIVYDSSPEKEYLETVNKVRALFSSVYRLKQDHLL